MGQHAIRPLRGIRDRRHAQPRSAVRDGARSPGPRDRRLFGGRLRRDQHRASQPHGLRLGASVVGLLHPDPQRRLRRCDEGATGLQQPDRLPQDAPKRAGGVPAARFPVRRPGRLLQPADLADGGRAQGRRSDRSLRHLPGGPRLAVVARPPRSDADPRKPRHEPSAARSPSAPPAPRGACAAAAGSPPPTPTRGASIDRSPGSGPKAARWSAAHPRSRWHRRADRRLDPGARLRRRDKPGLPASAAWPQGARISGSRPVEAAAQCPEEPFLACRSGAGLARLRRADRRRVSRPAVARSGVRRWWIGPLRADGRRALRLPHLPHPGIRRADRVGRVVRVADRCARLR